MKTNTTTAEATVLYDSNEAAQLKTVTGWVSRQGRFYGNDEHSARWDGSTHSKCECGNLAQRPYQKCNECREDDRLSRYMAKPFQEWDGNTPLYSEMDDRYFFSEDDLIDYCQENETTPTYLMLMICDPNEYDPVGEDHWVDVLPEEGEVHEKLAVALKALNEVIASLPPASWSAGKYRTTYQLPTES